MGLCYIGEIHIMCSVAVVAEKNQLMNDMNHKLDKII